MTSPHIWLWGRWSRGSTTAHVGPWAFTASTSFSVSAKPREQAARTLPDKGRGQRKRTVDSLRARDLAAGRLRAFCCGTGLWSPLRGHSGANEPCSAKRREVPASHAERTTFPCVPLFSRRSQSGLHPLPLAYGYLRWCYSQHSSGQARTDDQGYRPQIRAKLLPKVTIPLLKTAIFSFEYKPDQSSECWKFLDTWYHEGKHPHSILARQHRQASWKESKPHSSTCNEPRGGALRLPRAKARPETRKMHKDQST